MVRMLHSWLTQKVTLSQKPTDHRRVHRLSPLLLCGTFRPGLKSLHGHTFLFWSVNFKSYLCRLYLAVYGSSSPFSDFPKVVLVITLWIEANLMLKMTCFQLSVRLWRLLNSEIAWKCQTWSMKDSSNSTEIHFSIHMLTGRLFKTKMTRFHPYKSSLIGIFVQLVSCTSSVTLK